MSMTVSERNHADAYAGPGKSYPLYSNGDHLHAAYQLARGPHQAEIRAKVVAFAKKHGLTHLLPQTALDEMQQKATGGSRAAQLLSLAFNHESMEGDTEEKRRLIDFAQTHGLSDALPPEAHGFMHEQGIPHGHDGDENDGHPSEHNHPIMKAVNPVVKSFVIQKAYDGPTDETAIIEGWVSPAGEDSEHDEVPPECFEGALDEYVARKAPLSSDHDLRGYPIGHAQRLALVRDGKVFKSATHPTDSAEFEYFPGTGTGMYGRYLITDPVAATAIKAGNVGGFSWIGNLRSYEPKPGGGRRFLTVNPLRETTVAAYPINSKAVLTAVKAFQADLEAAEGENPNMGKLEDLLEGAAKQWQAQEEAKKAEQTVSKADLAQLFQELQEKVLAAVDDKVQKALPVTREEGVGRKGTIESNDPRESDPANYIIQKARKPEEMTFEDQMLAWGITYELMTRGMSNGDGE